MKKVKLIFLGLLFGLAPPVLGVFALEKPDSVVSYNEKNHKFHLQDCEWAKKCTQSCVLIKRSEAEKRGGIPCLVCGSFKS